MQKKKDWKSKIKLNDMLRLSIGNFKPSVHEKEIAEWFLEERSRFLAAITEKRDKIMRYIQLLTSNNCIPNNFYHAALLDKYNNLNTKCTEVTGQIERLSKLVAQ